MTKMNQQAASVLANGSFLELKQRLLFLLMALIVYRVGALVPVPGLDPARLASFFHQHSNGLLGMLNMFAGGALQHSSVFALGLMPYISASIIVQLFSSVSPHLMELRKEGEAGQRKLNQYTRMGTLALATVQSYGMCKLLVYLGIAPHPSPSFYFVGMLTFVTGTVFLMWLGEQVTERGIGNGISMIIFAGIVAGLPAAIGNTLESVRQGQLQLFALFIILAIVVLVTLFVVFVERGQRRITVNYPQRQQGKQRFMAQTSHLPLKINMAGVIPPIFASSILLFPATIARMFSDMPGFSWLADVSIALERGQPLYIVIFTAAVVFFCFFYTALVFNPKETADNLKRSGAFIPGIRPGDQTSRYIDKVMTRLTMIGAVYITLVCLMPEFMHSVWHVAFYFGGTSLLIIVVVVMDFVAQVQALLMSQQYDSLLKRARLKPGSTLQPVK